MPKFPVVTRSSTVGLDQRGFMPVVRYFVFVGGVLFGLLLAADRYMPAPAERSSAIDVDRSIIRIRSARNFPDKIVFDTATNPPAVIASGPIETEQHEDPRHALAMMPQDTRTVQPEPKPVARLAERRAPRLHRAIRKPTEPRVAMERHELFGGW